MLADTRRMHKSAYGRDPIDVDALVPTRAIDYHLSRVHVGTPIETVLADTRAEIDRARAGAEARLWTPARIAETLAYTRWRHEENRAEYAYIMHPTPPRRTS
jgi:hypothetical protein